VLLDDHEYDASTFTARQITWTLTDTYSVVTGDQPDFTLHVTLYRGVTHP
jgi:hypothetical protein